MRLRIGTRGLFAATSLALIAGCHGLTEPITPGTTFVLESVGGASLPAVSGTVSSAATLIADTLVFLSRGRNASGQVRHYGTVQIGTVVLRSTYVKSYHWHSGALRFEWPPCPPDAMCLNVSQISTSETGRFGPGSLTLVSDNRSFFPLTYRRLD